MENLIILAVVAVILALSGRYLYRAKKRGARCIGCPSGCSCNEKCGGCRLRPLCKVCPAAARLETGDYNGVPEYLCRNAKELYRLLKREV